MTQVTVYQNISKHLFKRIQRLSKQAGPPKGGSIALHNSIDQILYPSRAIRIREDHFLHIANKDIVI